MGAGIQKRIVGQSCSPQGAGHSPDPHRVWVGNLAPALPRRVLAETLQWLGLQVVKFALFHPSGGVNAAAVVAFGSEQEAEYAVTLLRSSTKIVEKAIVHARRANSLSELTRISQGVLSNSMVGKLARPLI